MTPRANAERVEATLRERPIPRSALQAAELEQQGHGELRVSGRMLQYVDLPTGIPFLTIPHVSRDEAHAQLRFYRQSFQDVLACRARFRIVA